MRKIIYVCDHCGKDMEDIPEFTVTFKSNRLAIYEPKEWHYCYNCWKQVETFLSTSKNISWIRTNDRYTPFSDCGCYIENTNKDNLNYKQATVSTSGEKTIQAKPMGDGPFTVGCCCENTNKDSLNYKQTTRI